MKFNHPGERGGEGGESGRGESEGGEERAREERESGRGEREGERAQHITARKRETGYPSVL